MPPTSKKLGGGRVVRWCWVNFQCRGVLLFLIKVGQGPTALAVGAGRGCLDVFTLVYHFSFLSPSLWETTRYRLKYCLKGSLSPKQPTNQSKKLKGQIGLGLFVCPSIHPSPVSPHPAQPPAPQKTFFLDLDCL